MSAVRSLSHQRRQTSNSAYFASLLSDNWIESNNGEDNEIFIDQIPSAFSILLDYMRRGAIKVEDIDTDILLLAEFLGMERLLLAVKVRWYCNIGRGPVHNTDDEIAAAFDQEYRGIMKAISSGLFPHFLKPKEIDAEKEFATFHIKKSVPPGGGRYTLKEVGQSGPAHRTAGVHATLNGLHLKGYTHYESQLKTKDTYTFSRRKHATTDSEATDILIPNDNASAQERNGHIKQFACVVKDKHDTIKGIVAPSEFDEDESRSSNPLNGAGIRDPGLSWLEDNGFVTRENAYEDIFREHMKAALGNDNVKPSIFSRMIVNERGDESW